MKGISEIIALLVLLGAVTLAFIATLVIIPSYFQEYNKVAMEASYAQNLPGFQTEASLTIVKRINDYAIIVIIYNSGDNPVTVNYNVYCEKGGSSYFVAEKNGVTIQPHSVYSNVFYVNTKNIDDKICYLVVEEPHLLIYKVLES